MRIFFVVPVMAFFISPAMAQDWNNLATSEAMNQVHASMRQNMIVEPSEDAADVRPRAKATARIDPTYPVDAQVRRSVQEALVSVVARKNKAAGEELAATFAKNDLIAMAHPALSAQGFRSGNVIDAVAIYRLAMWGAANTITTPPHRSVTAGIRRQVEATFDIAGAGLANPARRQRFAETLLYQAILIDLSSEQAAKTKNAAALGEIRASARKALVDSGIDPDRTQLTARGFMPAH